MPQTINAEWLLISICLPGGLAEPAGVLLLVRHSSQLFFRLKEDLNTGDEDVDRIWPLFAEELRLQTGQEGADAVFGRLETGFSNAIRVSDVRSLVVHDAAEALDVLYADHVEKGESVGLSA